MCTSELLHRQLGRVGDDVHLCPDPAAFAGVTDAVGMTRVMAGIPSNHSSLFAPVVSPTLGAGVAALVTAARAWLGPNA